MAKRSHSCCGRKFRNESALNQHTRDQHPGRKMKAAQPARRSWRPFFASFFGAVAGVLVGLSVWQYGAPLAHEVSAQTTGIVKAVLVTRR